MSLSKQEFGKYIKEFRFRELFIDMGWNNDRTTQPIVVDGVTWMLQAVAEKSGFKILECLPQEQGSESNGNIPDYGTRKKIETRVTKLFQEHLIIFYDAKKKEQVWQLVMRQTGKPPKLSETRYVVSQDPELLYQRASGLFFTIDEEENITIVDVTQRVAANFQQNNERVTKQFYDRFKTEHTSFLRFIKGISEKVNQEWYASLMLNRLMFCYFIQKRGFLDNNKKYLREKLKTCQERRGKDKFYSFYRNFLLVLFHDGLGAPNHAKDLNAEIGRVPYLNGGLFDEHELERNYEHIDIEDEAFERIFDFFDQYEWHLDTRITASGRDINPDVIGYIFEKYINDRAQMGAYYTKEDITEYISKNCILPFLFDETQRQYPKAFNATGEIWKSVASSGDTYIYDAVKKGLQFELPKKISRGIKDVAKRAEWNKQAEEDYALPTEIWREVVDRRQRYTDVLKKLTSGGINSINDFITYNLNIRDFAKDVLENTSDPEFLQHFYKSLESITILDPTCGSGAFLFAAMNILEPLYVSCLTRMRGFVEDEDRINAGNNKNFSHKFKFFRDVLKNIQSPQHPNQEYFIYKTIILQNLYGVDIMREAVEIAKLRLFLKLVATVDADYSKPNLGLEPLPDIDFNIRAGNTLVGFATEKELENHLIEDTLGSTEKNAITEACEQVAMAFARFKKIQLTTGDDFQEFKLEKEKLYKRLRVLNSELNRLMHKPLSSISLESWLASHQPFHWFAEFYEIMHDKGGFDVIIGNPPYLEFKQIDYRLIGFRTSETSAVHAVCIERAAQVKQESGTVGMIVPLSLVSTQRMDIVQQIISSNGQTYYSNFSWRPAKLFDTVNRALTIFLSIHTSHIMTFSSTYQKWTSDTREGLLDRIVFIKVPKEWNYFWIPKINSSIELDILSKIQKKEKRIVNYLGSSGHKIFYRSDGGLYWKVFTDFAPKFIVNGKEGSSTREVSVNVVRRSHVYSILAALSSNTFWWWYCVSSNCRHLNPYDVHNFPLDDHLLNDSRLSGLGKKYVDEIDKNSTMLTRIQKQTGETKTQSFKISQSKEIIDSIDLVLSEFYKFTEEELDFIINYDIKYRMGRELENDYD